MIQFISSTKKKKTASRFPTQINSHNKKPKDQKVFLRCERTPKTWQTKKREGETCLADHNHVWSPSSRGNKASMHCHTRNERGGTEWASSVLFLFVLSSLVQYYLFQNTKLKGNIPIQQHLHCTP